MLERLSKRLAYSLEGTEEIHMLFKARHDGTHGIGMVGPSAGVVEDGGKLALLPGRAGERCYRDSHDSPECEENRRIDEEKRRVNGEAGQQRPGNHVDLDVLIQRVAVEQPLERGRPDRFGVGEMQRPGAFVCNKERSKVTFRSVLGAAQVPDDCG